MKTMKWVVAGALVCFGGVAVAGEGSARAEEELQEAEQEVEAASNEAAEEGEEVRTGMERTAEETERDLEEGVDRAQEKAGEVGEKASGRAEDVGSGMASSIDEATSAVQGETSPLPRGALDDGDEVSNTLTTNPLGFFTGTGLNATYTRPISDKFSGVVGASFARASAGDGATTRLGVQLGADYFILGERNEGLRIGPRIEAGFGGETSGANSAFGSLGAAAELGYNWISARGFTAGAGAGVSAGLGGTTDEGDEAPGEDTDNFDAGFTPYARVNLGYSW